MIEKKQRFVEESKVEIYDATKMSEEEVLAQIEKSMSLMDQDTKHRVIFKNDEESFEDVLDKM